MFRLFLKIFKTPRNIITTKSEDFDQAGVILVGKKIESKVKRLFRGSLAIRQVDAGSDNACEQELVALSNTFYDVERFGIHFVASPRHADMLLVTGPVTRNMAEALKRAYEAAPEPKIVVTVGDDAIRGGIFEGSYAVLDSVDAVVPVNYHISGNPPSPKTILLSLLGILEDLERVPNKGYQPQGRALDPLNSQSSLSKDPRQSRGVFTLSYRRSLGNAKTFLHFTHSLGNKS